MNSPQPMGKKMSSASQDFSRGTSRNGRGCLDWSNTHHHKSSNKTTLQQTTLDQLWGFPARPLMNTQYGHFFENHFTYKSPTDIRILSQNINGMPSKCHHDKTNIINHFLHSQPADVILWQEINLIHWPKLSLDCQWKYRSPNSKYSTIFSFNSQETPSRPFQSGGTAILCSPKIISRKLKLDTDMLGRWSWLQVGNRRKGMVTFISAYCP